MYELCWNITDQCNMGCKYCHRFLNVKNLTEEENKKTLQNILDCGIKNITWTGGEALLLDFLPNLLREAHQAGVKNKLITNGLLLNKRLPEIKDYLDSVTLSIDSTRSLTNKVIGRGEKHFEQIAKNIKEINKCKIPLSINSVLTKVNMDDIIELGEFLQENNITRWRIFKFMPLREISIRNKELFDISNEEYQNKIQKITKLFPNIKLEERTISELEKLYVLILANGDIVVTKNNKDVTIGNALNDNLKVILKKLSESIEI